MTERKYKVGDKVRMLEDCCGLMEGEERTITDLDCDDFNQPYEIEGVWIYYGTYEHLPSEPDSSDLINNTTPFGLLALDVQERMMAWEYGFEFWGSINNSWVKLRTEPMWERHRVYRCLPAPVEPKRITTWHNVYEGGAMSIQHKSRAKADAATYKRIAVYRIERNADGSDPQIFVKDV